MTRKNPGSKKPAASKKSAASKKTARKRPNETEALQEEKTSQLFVPHIENLELSAGLESGEDVYAEILESICGVRDDSQAVEQYNGTLGVTTAFVAAHQAPVCQVQWNNNLASIYTNPGNVSGVRWGTGTMISNDIMLTCGHLFDQTGGGWNRPRINGTTNIISPQDIARNMHVNFNYQVNPSGVLRAEQSFPILQLIEFRLGGLDMAVCRIGGNPGAIFGRTIVSTTDAASPQMICIIGHPAGQPKRIEAGPTTRIDGNLIRYNDIDTLGGNSGSGILRASDGKLVGIHTNGGCTASSPSDGGSNFGQRIAAVIAVSPTLQAITRPVKLKVPDDVKLKIRDDIATIKFRDDQPPKPKFRDDILTLKFRDDVKSPVFDKGFDTRVDPFRGGGGEGQGARPFILSTPHHSSAWQQQAGGYGASEQEEMEAMLMQYEQAISSAHEELSRLENEYQEFCAQYESWRSGGQQG